MAEQVYYSNELSMKLALILTNDWELFGDGSGDFFDVQHKPTEELLEILRDFNAKISLMAEVGQQWGFQSLAEKNNKAKDITIAWEDILKKTVELGSDVQLHYHPQWLNSKFENDKWLLDMKHWALSSLSPDRVKQILTEGKKYLEELLKAVNPDYSCIAFRAGAYCIQPEEEIIKSLLCAGFLADTSVTKGLKGSGFYDFSSAVSNIIPWFANPKNINLKNNNKNGLLELPIYSIQEYDSPAMKKFTPNLHNLIFGKVSIPERELKWQREREKTKNIRYPKENRFYKQYSKKDLAFYLSAIFSKQTVQLDYDYLTATQFVEILKEIFEDKTLTEYSGKDVYLPVVASGHIKDIHNCDNIKWIFEYIEKELPGKVEYWTLSKVVKYWRDIVEKS